MANVAAQLLSSGADDAIALLYEGKPFTYGQLRDRVSAVAGELRAAGQSPVPIVPLFAENSPFFAAAYLGIMAAGMCVAPLPVDMSQSMLERVLASTGATLAFVSRRMHRQIGSWLRARAMRIVDEQELASWTTSRGKDHFVSREGADLAALMFTSGSTGDAKGVMVTHKNIETNTRDIAEYLSLQDSDRVMVVLPFTYCYGASLLHTHLLAGASLVINNNFMFPEKVLDAMRDDACTGFAGVPSTYQVLLRKTRFAERQIPSLRWLQQAGGKLHDAYIREITAAFPRARFYCMYGQTEATARLSYLPPERLADKLGSIGRGLPSTRLEVLDQNGRAVRPGSDEVGEIVASGDNIARGYWRDAEETALFFRRGKLYTGDMARVDEDGFIYLVERARDFIKSGGNRVSAGEVESVIAELPEIVEVAVIGFPHELWGEAVKAYVVLQQNGGLSADDIRHHCSRHLPNFKVPESIHLVDSLPKNAAGKINKAALRRESQTSPPGTACNE